jgi:hypothetical protein
VLVELVAVDAEPDVEVEVTEVADEAVVGDALVDCCADVLLPMVVEPSEAEEDV